MKAITSCWWLVRNGVMRGNKAHSFFHKPDGNGRIAVSHPWWYGGVIPNTSAMLCNAQMLVVVAFWLRLVVGGRGVGCWGVGVFGVWWRRLNFSILDWKAKSAFVGWLLLVIIVVVSRILSSSSSYFVHFLILALANPEGLAISNIKIHTK